MRDSRLIIKSSYFHISSRAHNELYIFEEDRFKTYLLYLIFEAQKLYKIHIIAYCIMDNHYHLIIKNQSGKMSEFMRYINGSFAGFYRREAGGKGYVFQGRYDSIIIQDDPHMIKVLRYVLLNPVKAKIVKNPFKYEWSSINLYFKNSTMFYHKLIENYFITKANFRKYIKNSIKDIDNLEVPAVKTPIGYFIGDAANISNIIKMYNRRDNKNFKNSSRMRKQKDEFKSIKIIIKEFEKEFHVKINNIDTGTYRGKKLRGFLLLKLREEGGLTYKEIAKMKIFKHLKFKSLPELYRYYKKKYKKENQK